LGARSGAAVDMDTCKGVDVREGAGDVALGEIWTMVFPVASMAGGWAGVRMGSATLKTTTFRTGVELL